MKTFIRRTAIILLVFAIGMAGISVQASKPTQGIDLNQAARSAVATTNNVPVDQLTMVASTESTPGNGQKVVYSYKFLDTKTWETYVISIDADGNQVDLQSIVNEASAAVEAKYGHVDQGLADRLASAPANQPVRVIIWLYQDESSIPKKQDLSGLTDEAEIEAASRAHLDAVAANVSSLTTPVVDRLTSMGYAAQANTLVPFVYTSLTPNKIQEVASWPEVRMVYEDVQDTTKLDIAWKSAGYWYVFYKYHTVGRGTKVGVVEVNGRAASSNPYLDWYTQSTTNVCASADAHATAVLGIIYSSHPVYTGFAEGTTAWVGGSCGGWISETQAAASAAASWGANVINYSAGSNVSLVPTSNDVFWDNMVRNSNVTSVIAAGNENPPCGPDGDITSPALGYNMIAVGNYDDHNTESWADDTMNTCSSWKDPISTFGDREKPEVTAPGTNFISTTTAFPWTGGVGSGTSYAAPVVTSAVALAYKRQINRGSGIAAERFKAIMMAGATHNIEGSNRLSEYDGAGAVYFWETDRIAAGTNSDNGWLSYTCASADPLTLGTISLIGNNRTRVAIVWSQPTTYANYTTQPSADLDLEIYSPTNAYVTGSHSFDNTYEIVDFMAPVTGNYTVKVDRHSCAQSPDYLAWAWWRK